MSWDIPYHNRATAVTGLRSKCRCFSWALLLAVLVISVPEIVHAEDTSSAAADLKFNQAPRPFTTAEIRTLLYLMDRAKQRVNPEYYLSEEYLDEVYVAPNISRQHFAHQLKWEQVALKREKLHYERIMEREASRQRIKKLREQERNIQRIHREAKITFHRQEFCAQVQRRARRIQYPNFSGYMGYRIPPKCL